MPKYEYVPKNEYQPVREELEKIIKKVQKLLKNKFTFQFVLVGSGKKKLITREIGGNKGFDFDYNLILNNPDDEHYWKPDFAKQTLLKAFNQVVKNTDYDCPEDSKTAITIKVKDINNSKIIHSCDFAIIYYPNEDESNYYKYVRHDKKNNVYTWEIRNCSRYYDDKLNWLKENIRDYWTIIKNEYLKVKNNNKDTNKHSFQLYLETINNLFNQYAE